MSAFDLRRLDRMREVLVRHEVGGLAWLVAVGDEVHTGTAGVLTRGEPAPVERDSLFRIASVTKPIVTVAALLLVEECRVRMDEPVDDVLPELADRRVLVDPSGPIDGPTVPAERPITLRDLLTFRLGLGMDFERPWPQPLLEAMDELGLGAGPPAPAAAPEPDEWMRRLGTLPLLHQPGQRWLYNVGAQILGVLIARVAGQPLDVFVRERVLEPLGMNDTAFSASDTARMTSCYWNPHDRYDPPDGQWSQRPAFPSAADGLVSTVDDIHAFGRMLLDGGAGILAPATVRAMTTDQLGVLGGANGPTSPTGTQGWGFGVGVGVRGTDIGRGVGSYGWDGGLGSSWANDPAHGLVGVILTTDAFTSHLPPPVVQDFWTCAYAALT